MAWERHCTIKELEGLDFKNYLHQIRASVDYQSSNNS